MIRRGTKLAVPAALLLALAAACNGKGSSGAAGASSGSGGGKGAPREEPSISGGGELEHVLSTGQSNSVGFHAVPVLSTTQPYGNLSFDVGVMTTAACDGDGCRAYQKPSGFVPLVEGDTYDAGPVETMSSGLANTVGRLLATRDPGGRHDMLVSVHGRSGWVYECMRKGSCSYRTDVGYTAPFEEGMRQVEDAMALAKAQGRAYVVRAVTAVHGESDHYDSMTVLDGTDGTPGAIRSYADALLEWQRDYDTEIRARTGQTQAVPLLVSQMANWNDRVTSEIPVRQLEAHVRAPGKVVLVGATYALPFGPDCIHFTSEGQRTLGEYFGKAYARIVLEGGTWEPLRPVSAQLDGSAVTVRFLVPKPPLVLDTQAVSDPGGFGFVFDDDSGAPPAVTGVEIVGTDTVRVTLAAPPTGRTKHLRYALDARPDTCPGPQTGPRGNVRDSDETVSATGGALPNWSVAFDWGL